MTLYPIGVQDLSGALPHRAPMIWIDQVLSAAEDGGVCAIDLVPGRLAADEEGRCLTFAPVEWLAQAYGYARASFERERGTRRGGARRAYLCGIAELRLVREVPRSGRLLAEVRLVREMSPLVLVAGTLRTEGGETLATARLKLFFE